MSTISPPDDGALELLNSRLVAFLATLNKDGSIHLVPIWYLFEDGRFFMETSSTTRKARNIQARPQATVTVEARNHEFGSRPRALPRSSVASRRARSAPGFATVT